LTQYDVFGECDLETADDHPLCISPKPLNPLYFTLPDFTAFAATPAPELGTLVVVYSSTDSKFKFGYVLAPSKI